MDLKTGIFRSQDEAWTLVTSYCARLSKDEAKFLRIPLPVWFELVLATRDLYVNLEASLKQKSYFFHLERSMQGR